MEVDPTKIKVETSESSQYESGSEESSTELGKQTKRTARKFDEKKIQEEFKKELPDGTVVTLREKQTPLLTKEEKKAKKEKIVTKYIPGKTKIIRGDMYKFDDNDRKNYGEVLSTDKTLEEI